MVVTLLVELNDEKASGGHVQGSFDMWTTCCCVTFDATPRHQELAVEDMRHELDDEGRREFFEEQGEDGDGNGGGRCVLLVCVARSDARRFL